MKSTRRQFLSAAAASSALAGLPHTLFAQPAGLAADPRRPQFHLLPACNWMNDPNAPVYFNGSYHMFFQYNPGAAVWGDMNWNHAVSPDMIHWTHLPIALSPTPGSADEFGCFSGTAVPIGKRCYAVYTGVKKMTGELVTLDDGNNQLQEAQCLAWSDDPHLRSWQKEPLPIVPLPPPGLKVSGFRDPSVWKQGNFFYMTVGAGEFNVGGCVLLYRSPAASNLRQWEYLHKLTGGAWTGTKTPNPCDDGEMWECPDFFELDGGHVLIYSTLGKVFWQSGVLDPSTLTFKSAKTGLLDLDAFYAPKTQLDAHNRRILWGWVPERRSEDAMRLAGWSGMMSLPRVLNLDKDGTLRITTLPQLASLRAAPIAPHIHGPVQTLALPAATGEIMVTSSPGSGPLEIVFENAADRTELLRAAYKPETHSIVADGKSIPLTRTDVPAFHAFVDGSVIELILAERTGCTKRFYFAQSSAPDILVRVTGSPSATHAWTINPISGNRLTTPAA